MILEEGKNFWTPKEAHEVLKVAYPSYSAFMSKVYRKQLPRHGGQGTGQVIHFTREDLLEISEMGAVRPQKVRGEKTASNAEGQVIELPEMFRQTPRSRARHRNAV